MGFLTSGVTPAHFMLLSAILFTLGVFGIFLNRRNVIVILMSVELILLSVTINMVAFSSLHGDLTGQVFSNVHSDRGRCRSGDWSGHSGGVLP